MRQDGKLVGRFFHGGQYNALVERWTNDSSGKLSLMNSDGSNSYVYEFNLQEALDNPDMGCEVKSPMRMSDGEIFLDRNGRKKFITRIQIRFETMNGRPSSEFITIAISGKGRYTLTLQEIRLMMSDFQRLEDSLHEKEGNALQNAVKGATAKPVAVEATASTATP